MASLPLVSLILGAAGALAIVALAALLSAAGGPVTTALRHCGHRSIVIYLAFFLPMAATRTLIVKTGLVADIGLASLIVMAMAVLLPLALDHAIRGTVFDVLFRRPKGFSLIRPRRARGEALQPA